MRLPLVAGAGVAVLTASSLLSAQTADNAETEKTENRQIEEVIVVGTKQQRYIVNSSDALTGIDLDFLENPRNVTILPEQLILDRKITTLEEALRNVPGVSAADGFGGTRDDFFVRGFRRNATYRNGFRRETIFKTNLSNIEYTQVIRGPASIRYGRVEPGGVVDVVTKKPLQERRISGEVRYGSFDDAFALLDWSQPINDSAAFRVVASVQDSESFRDFYDVSRDTAALSFRYNVSDATRVDLSYEYREESRPLDRGTVAVPTTNGFEVVNELLDIPDRIRFGDPFEEYDVDFSFAEITLSHAFNERWSARLGLAYEDSTSNDLQSRPRQAIVVDADAPITDDGFFDGGIPVGGIFDDPTDRVFLFKGLDGSRNRKSEVSYLNLLITGAFDTGPIKHRVSFGGDYRDSDQSRQFARGENTNGLTVPLFNIQMPSYTLSDEFSLEGVAVDSFTEEDLGAFLNVYSELTDRLGLLLGIRYSETESRNFFPDFNVENLLESEGWSPMVGVSFRITDNTALYGSYSESFTPNDVVPDFEGTVELIDPEIGEQFELGIKAEFFDGRAQASLAVYQIEKTNVVIGSDELGRPILAEGSTSDGIEFGIAGQPLPGMNLTASYAYIDAKTSAGVAAPGVADQLFNVYASYEWQGGTLEGLGVGGGIYYEAERFVDVAGLVELDDYMLVDLSTWYTIETPRIFGDAGTIRFQVALKNIFDETYYGGGSGVALRIPLGVPRSVFGSVSFDI